MSTSAWRLRKPTASRVTPRRGRRGPPRPAGPSAAPVGGRAPPSTKRRYEAEQRLLKGDAADAGAVPAKLFAEAAEGSGAFRRSAKSDLHAGSWDKVFRDNMNNGGEQAAGMATARFGRRKNPSLRANVNYGVVG